MALRLMSFVASEKGNETIFMSTEGLQILPKQHSTFSAAQL